MVLSGANRTVFLNGTVRSFAPDPLESDALLVADGRIAAVGDEARRAAGAAEVVDLGGGCLLPSFGEGHIHALVGGTELSGIPVAGVGSIEQVLARVRAHAREKPEQEWLVGAPFEPSIGSVAELRAELLDTAVADRPVMLTSADHHTHWCNSAALEAAGISAATPDPPGGAIVRDGSGNPSGVLLEDAAAALVTRLIPGATRAEQCRALGRTSDALAAAGVTWLQEAWAEPEQVDAFLAAARSGDLTIRAGIALNARPGEWREQLPAFLAARERAASDPAVSVGTVKLFLDGVTLTGTAAMLDPYEDGGTGLLLWEDEELLDCAAAFDGHGFQLHMHAMGDRANRQALDAVQALSDRNGPRDRRPVVAHAGIVHPDDLDRFAALGVVTCFQPLWAQPDRWQTELVTPRLGAERAGWQYPIGSLTARDARVSFGSDWPVTSLRPLDGLAIAVTRQTPAGEPADGWFPHQRVSAEAAFAAYTSGVAYQAFEEGCWGTLAPGSRADLVLLEADPLTRPPAQWPALAVVGTWSAGRRIWPAAGRPEA